MVGLEPQAFDLDSRLVWFSLRYANSDSLVPMTHEPDYGTLDCDPLIRKIRNGFLLPHVLLSYIACIDCYPALYIL